LTPSPPSAARRAWIVSPAWDLAYLVLTPLAIVPTVLVAVRHWLTPEQVYLAVIAFASLGHHLPGFMRAYGDRALFRRFRLRFILAPPLVFAAALVFTPPPSVAAALKLPWTHLHGLELILLLWGTWHGLMQTYGFMRIYDLRGGAADRRSARLDHALCLAIFIAGIVFSDTRMFAMAGAMWQAGLPLFGPETLIAMRWIVGLASAAVLLAYAAAAFERRRRGMAINVAKLLLAAVTGWFWWYCGRLSTNLLIGVAMFEIYHAVQYNAIVWVYNRRLLERAGARFGPLGFLFRDRSTMLGLYLAAIAAYSSIRYFTAQPNDRMFSGDLAGAHQWLIALFVASSILHFYYDGFIWKVSEQKTGENLVDAAGVAAARERVVPGLVHAGKWVSLAAVAAFLVAAEWRYEGPAAANRQADQRRALAALTPAVPEAAMLASQEALAAGDVKVQQLLREDRVEEAIATLTDLLKQHPDDAETNYRLGFAWLKRGVPQRAVPALRTATKLEPRHVQAWLQLGDALMALAKPGAAIAPYERAVALRPDSANVHVSLANAQLQSGRAAAAESTLRDGLARQPKSADLHLTLGLVLERRGASAEAARHLKTAGDLGLNVDAAHDQR
jgi:tetratricopeptide (TPR) repeat protein